MCIRDRCVCGAGSLKKDMCVYVWCRKFKEGHIDVSDKGSQMSKCVAMEEVVEQVYHMIYEKFRLMILKLFAKFPQARLNKWAQPLIFSI